MHRKDDTICVNLEKKGINDALSQLYMKLGKEYYEGAFEDPLPQLLPLFDKITSIKNDMVKKEEAAKSDRSQPEKCAFCPNCGKPVEMDAMYCGSCGFKVR